MGAGGVIVLGGRQPGNEENEAGCYFSPEKPRLPLSIEGNATITYSPYF